MTKLEREKYLLALNDGQRLALLIGLSNHLIYTNALSLEGFDDFLTAYHPMEVADLSERGNKRREE